MPATPEVKPVSIQNTWPSGSAAFPDGDPAWIEATLAGAWRGTIEQVTALGPDLRIDLVP